jgi:hypothetical protein
VFLSRARQQAVFALFQHPARQTTMQSLGPTGDEHWN